MRNIFDNLPKSMYSAKDAITRFGNKTRDYIATGPVYHISTAATFPAVAGLYSVSAQGILEKVVASLGTVAIVAYLQLLAKHRYRDDKEIKADLERHGYVEERMLPYLTPWVCRRYAARRAARQVGFTGEIERTIKNHNIKWYHIGPRNPIDWVNTGTNRQIFKAIVNIVRRA